MTHRHGTARLRSLAAELKELRHKANLTTRQAAERVGILSASSLNRMELGNRAIHPEELSALLVVYGVTGAERERLLNLARDAALSVWWDAPGARRPQLRSPFRTFEAQAVSIAHVAVLRIPGLMQTAEYCREVIGSAGVTGSALDDAVSSRLGRAAALTRPKPLRYLAFIDEPVLRRRVGSCEVMVQQLRHLLTVVRLPNVDIRVIPFDRGMHTGLDGTFSVMTFEKARSIVYLEHKRGALFCDDPADVRPYQEAVGVLMKQALDSPDSVDFIDGLAVEFEKR